MLFLYLTRLRLWWSGFYGSYIDEGIGVLYEHTKGGNIQKEGVASMDRFSLISDKPSNSQKRWSSLVNFGWLYLLHFLFLKTNNQKSVKTTELSISLRWFHFISFLSHSHTYTHSIHDTDNHSHTNTCMYASMVAFKVQFLWKVAAGVFPKGFRLDLWLGGVG